MSVAVTGILLIVMALAFNAAFALLAARFDYPRSKNRRAN
jgi:hypothetical protein